jgi:hypothetical protein
MRLDPPLSGPTGPQGSPITADEPGGKQITVGGLALSDAERSGVAIEAIHWEHYCRRVEGLDMPSLDEANFFTGSAGVFLTTIVALVGVAFSHKPSPVFIGVLVALLFASGMATAYFWRKYDYARKNMVKNGAAIATEMREVALIQLQREREKAAATESAKPKP